MEFVSCFGHIYHFYKLDFQFRVIVIFIWILQKLIINAFTSCFLRCVYIFWFYSFMFPFVWLGDLFFAPLVFYNLIFLLFISCVSFFFLIYIQSSLQLLIICNFDLAHIYWNVSGLLPFMCVVIWHVF